jgi:hypothetical protein
MPTGTIKVWNTEKGYVSYNRNLNSARSDLCPRRAKVLSSLIVQVNAPLVVAVPKISDRWSADDGFAWSYTEQLQGLGALH